MALQVVAYYTADDVYAQHAQLLQRSLSRFGIEHELIEIPAQDWLSATALKPNIILQKLESSRSPVLYLDIDCVVQSDIQEYFDGLDADIAIHTRPDGEMLSGTVFFKYSDSVLDLLRQWVSKLEAEPTMWDQVALQQVLASPDNAGLKVHPLLAEFVYIFDVTKEEDPSLVPIIEHLQASREGRYLEKMKTLKHRLLRPLGILPKSSCRLRARRERVDEIANELGVDFKHGYDI